jgi:hypothetical protein
MSALFTILTGLYMGVSSLFNPSADAFDAYNRTRDYDIGKEKMGDFDLASFSALRDNLGNEGVIIEVTYRPNTWPETNLDAINAARDALHRQLNAKKNMRFRMQVLDEWDNGDGSCSAKILASEPLRNAKTYYAFIESLSPAYYVQ